MHSPISCRRPSRSEIAQFEADEWHARAPKDPVPCPADCEDGCGGTEYRHGDPQQEYSVPCERCEGRGVVDWDDYSEDEQIEYLQAEVDMLRERLEPTTLFDDLGVDGEEVA